MSSSLDLFLDINLIALIFIALFAGFVKGVVGFAMPLIMFSGFILFLSQEEAISLIIIPSLVSNLLQAYGTRSLDLKRFLHHYYILLVIMVLMILITSQFYLEFSKNVIYVILAILIFVFLYFQIRGVNFVIKKSNKQAQLIFGLIAGFFGGISGQWGPPLVIFFLSQNLKVGQFIRFQGIVYSIGSVSLLFGHLQSGVLTKDLTLLSLPLVFICCLGQLIGYMVRTFQHIDGIKKFSLICLFAFGILLIIRAVLSGFQILNL